MKNIFIIFTTLLFGLMSCSKDNGVGPDPEPDVDYSIMIPKIIAKLTTYQAAFNKKDYDAALALTVNQNDISFKEYPKGSVASQVEDNSKFTITISGIKEDTTSKIENGSVKLVADIKIVTEEPDVPKIEVLLQFKGTFTCSGDKLVADNWSISEFKLMK